MVTKHSSFFNSAPRYFSQGQIDSDTAFSGSMLLRKYAGAQQALLRACAIVPSQALIPQRTRQTLIAWSRLCNQTSLPQAFWKPVLTTKCQWWNEMTNVVTPYLSKVDTWFPFKMSIERALKRWSSTRSQVRFTCPRTHGKENLRNDFAFSCAIFAALPIFYPFWSIYFEIRR